MPRTMLETLKAIVRYMRNDARTDTVKYALVRESVFFHAGMSETSVKRYLALMLELKILRPAGPLAYFFDKRAYEKLLRGDEK